VAMLFWLQWMSGARIEKDDHNTSVYPNIDTCQSNLGDLRDFQTRKSRKGTNGNCSSSQLPHLKGRYFSKTINGCNAQTNTIPVSGRMGNLFMFHDL
jgi:hypothetical protein